MSRFQRAKERGQQLLTESRGRNQQFLKEGPAPRAQKAVGYFLSEMPLAPELYAIWFALKDPDVSLTKKVLFLTGGGAVGGVVGSGAGFLLAGPPGVPVGGSFGGSIGTGLAAYSLLVDRKHQDEARSYLESGKWHPILEAQQSAARKALANPGAGSEGLVEVLAVLKALHWTAWAAHWKVRGDYGDHLLFERITKLAYESMDPLAERIIGRDGNSVFDEATVGAKALVYVQKAQQKGDLVERLLYLEGLLGSAITSALSAGGLSAGLRAHLEQLEDNHSEAVYLLQQRLPDLRWPIVRRRRALTNGKFIELAGEDPNALIESVYERLSRALPNPKRACSGCGRFGRVSVYDGGYWHLSCFERASEPERRAARLKDESVSAYQRSQAGKTYHQGPSTLGYGPSPLVWCEMCGGNGYLVGSEWDAVERCPTCSGSGRVRANPKKNSLPKNRNVALQVHIEQRKGAGAGAHKSKGQRGGGKGSGKWGRHKKHKGQAD